MFYYKTTNGYEKRNIPAVGDSMQEITQQEYEDAMATIKAERKAEIEAKQAAKEEAAAEKAAEAADLAEALSILGYEEAES